MRLKLDFYCGRSGGRSALLLCLAVVVGLQGLPGASAQGRSVSAQPGKGPGGLSETDVAAVFVPASSGPPPTIAPLPVAPIGSPIAPRPAYALPEQDVSKLAVNGPPAPPPRKERDAAIELPSYLTPEQFPSAANVPKYRACAATCPAQDAVCDGIDAPSKAGPIVRVSEFAAPSVAACAISVRRCALNCAAQFPFAGAK